MVMAFSRENNRTDDHFDLNTVFANDHFYLFRKYPDQLFTFAIPKTSSELKNAVVNSKVARVVVKKICQSGKKNEREAKEEVIKIVKEIGHTMNKYSVRILVFALSQISRRIFKHIYVNESGIKQLKELSRPAQMIFVPGHNSYYDSLLLLLVFFMFDLPLPAAAGAEDFLDMAIMKDLLRQSFVFFLRRSNAKDDCFTLLFKEYVRQLVSCAATPLLFFVEGTRSRTGKGLQPKTGLLSMVNEAYFSCRSPDLFYCPVSVSYEYIPESSFHIYEVLGIPKPKERFKTIWNARHSLSYNLGTVNIHIGKCVSLEDISKSLIDRRLYNSVSIPKEGKEKLYRNERKLNHDFARMLVHEQQSNMTLYLTSVVAAVMLPRKISIRMDALLFQCCAVMNLLKEITALLEPNDELNHTCISSSVRLLNPTVDCIGDEVVKFPFAPIKEELVMSPLGMSLKDKDLLGHVLTYTSLSQQRNRLLHRCSIPAFIAISLLACKDSYSNIVDIRYRFELIHMLMNVELVYHPYTDWYEEMERGLGILEASSCIKIQRADSGRLIKRVNSEAGDFLFSFFYDLFFPFLETYWFVGHSLMSESAMQTITLLALSKQLQQQAAKALEQGLLRTYEALSLHTLANALKWFIQAKALLAHRDSNLIQVITGKNPDKLLRILKSIETLTDLTSEMFFSGKDNIKLKGKL